MGEVSNNTLQAVMFDYLQSQKSGTVAESENAMGLLLRWFGEDRDITELSPVQIEEYCSSINDNNVDSSATMKSLKKFFSTLYKNEIITLDLSRYIKIRKRKTTIASTGQGHEEQFDMLTQEGWNKLEQEVKDLRLRREDIAEDIRKAAATGDFSENAPLDAAREAQGKNEGRIREIEETLKKSRVMDSKSIKRRGKSAAFVGSTIVIKNRTTNKQNSYMLVESSESNPKEGKLSIQSPIGRAIYGMPAGSEVEIQLPNGEANLFYLSSIK